MSEQAIAKSESVMRHSSGVAIEPLRMEHLANLAQVLRVDAVYKHIGGTVPSETDFITGLQRALAGPRSERSGENWLNYLVSLEETRQMIGRLEATVVADRAEVAFLFSPPFWGRGFAAHGLSWLERAAIAEHKVTALWATTVPANVRCQRLLDASGYVPVEPADAPKLASYDPGDLIYRKAATG